MATERRPVINVDPLNSTNAPSLAELLQVRVRWVRLVSRPGVEGYAEACMDAGIMVLAVVTEQSGGYICPCDTVQLGNEPDVAGTADTMSPAVYVSYWNLYRETYPDLIMISAGLGSGQTGYWRQVQDAGGLKGAAGFAVHPYAKTAAQAQTLLKAYKAITPGLPLWCSEINRSAAEMPEFAAMLRAVPVVMWSWFCWSVDVAQNVGIWPLDARAQRMLAAVT